MKKLLLILIVMLVWAGNSRAQVSTYLFSSSTGTYTEITDGTVLTTSADDDNFDANDIGFTFTYNGVPYTQFSVNNNGFIAMGETVISNTSALSSGLNNNVIAPQSEDLQTNTTGAELSYQLSGSSPNQVLTIQWKNYRHYNATGESYNFQIKLYETTNVIQFVYGSYTKNTTTRTAQVGLRGASNDDFNNRATTTDWTATTAGATNTASCDLSPTVYPPSGLTFTFTPATCFAPSGLNVSDISTVEATIAWTAAIPAPANGYEYEIRTSGDVGSGPAGLVATGSTAAGDVDDDVSGLTPGGTQHYLYVRSVCGEEDYSNWALTTFTTSCANITSYPYTQSFASVLDSCWSSVSEDAEGASYHWAVTTNDASHGVSGPQEGTHFAFLNVYNAETSYNPYYLKTLAFELGETPKQVKYYYYLGDEGYTDSPVPLTLQISNDNGSTWTDLYLHTEANSTFSSTSDLSGWYLNTVNLSAYANQTVIFRFASNSYYSYGYCNQGIDEFTVEEVPACPQPSSLKATNINNNSADLGWTETGTATLWNIELGAPGFTPGTGTNLIGVTGTTSNPWPATGGSGNTTYEFYVQADCGGDVSSWAGPYSFTTLCDAVTSYPWTENFDTMNTIGNSIIPLCWTIESASGTPWASANAASNTYNDPATTPNYITCYWSPTSSNKYLITPGFNMTTGNSYNISFNYVGDGNSGWNVDVGYNTAQTGTDYSILGDAILSGETSSTSYETLTRTFYPSTSGTYYFVVRISNNYTPNYFGLDDFMVTETPVPTPVITSIEDTAGCVGSALVIHGTDLTGATDVTIGGTAAEITGNTDTTVTVTVGTGTTGTVEVTTPGGTASSTQTFTVNQLPQLFVVSGGGEYCQGGTGVVINLSGSMNGVNYDLSTTPVTTIEGTGSALTFGPTAFSTGTYTITATDTLTGCSALMTDSANVVVNPLPSDVTANASSNSICIGDTINLFSSANSNVYNTVNYFEGFEVLPPAGWTSYNEGLGNDWGAIDVSHSGNLSMFYHYSDEPADAWGITGPMALDAGTTYTISFWYMVESDYYPEKLKVTVGDAATVLAQTTTLWDNNGDTALFNETWEQAVISFNPVTSGTYYFGFNCYSDADMYNLYVDDVAITGTTEFPVTYSWTSDPPGFTSNQQNPTGVTPSETTEYIVTVENSYGCIATNSTTVVMNPLPTATVSVDNDTVCAGDEILISINLSGTGPWLLHGLTRTEVGGSSYTLPDTIVDSSPFQIDDNPILSTYYHIESYTDNATGCTNDSANWVSVFVKELPTAIVQVDDDTICIGDTITISISLSGSGPWLLQGLTKTEFGGSPESLPDTLVNTSPFIIKDTPHISAYYHIESFEDYSTGCSNDSANWVTVYVNPLPTAEFSVSDTSICIGETVQFTINLTGSGPWTLHALTVSKFDGTEDVLPDMEVSDNPHIVSMPPLSSAYYHVESIIDNGTGCTNDTANWVTVVVNELPEPTITGEDSVCFGLLYDYTTEGGMENYVWNVEGGVIASGGTTADTSITIAWDVVGTQHLSVNYTNPSGCEAADSTVFFVSVFEVTVPEIIGDTAVCLGTASNIYYTQDNMLNYVWTISAGGTILSGQNTDSLTVVWNDARPQTVSVLFENTHGCAIEFPVSYNVIVYNYPQVSLGNDTTICADQNIILDAGNTGALFSWTPDGEDTQTITADTVGHGIGTIQYIVEVDFYGCIAYDTINVTFDPCTGINENNEGISINVIPNPSNGLFYLNVEGIEGNSLLTIYSINGQIIFSEQIDNSGLVNKPIDLKSFPKGMYFLRLMNNNMTHTEKIIIE